MEVFGIGPMELILILIIAMMVFGPEKLPEIGAKLGQSMRAMRRATREFSREVEEARQAIEAPIQELKQPLQEVTQPIQDIREQFAPVAKAVTNPQEALRQAVTPSIAPPRPADGNGSDRTNASRGEHEAADAVMVEEGVVVAAGPNGADAEASPGKTAESELAEVASGEDGEPSAREEASAPDDVAAPARSRQPIIFPEE